MGVARITVDVMQAQPDSFSSFIIKSNELCCRREAARCFMSAGVSFNSTMPRAQLWRRQDFEPGGTARMFTKASRNHKNFYINITSRVRPPNGGRNEANSDIDTGYTNVVAVALAKTAANYFVILISM